MSNHRGMRREGERKQREKGGGVWKEERGAKERERGVRRSMRVNVNGFLISAC